VQHTHSISLPCPPFIAALRIPLLLALLFGVAKAHAETYCAASVGEFQNALSAAAATIDYDEIRLVRGTYANPNTFVYGSANRGWMFIGGGWEPGCTARVYDASATVLDGGGTHQVLQMAYTVTGSTAFAPRFTVDNLTVQNGLGSGFVRGGGISMASFAAAPAQAELFIDNVIVRNSSGYFAGGVDLYAERGLARVVNSLFVGNSAPTSAFGHLSITINGSEAGNGQCTIIANSTFVDGTCASSGGRGCGIGVSASNGLRVDVLNSVFANNVTSDINIETYGTAAGTAFVDSSLVGTTGGTITPTITRAITGPPGFVDAAAGNFRLRNDSPLLNRGLGVPAFYGYNSFDLDGAQRVRNGVLDVGAFENQPFVFANGFE